MLVTQRRHRNLPKSVLPSQSFWFPYYTCCFFDVPISVVIVVALSSLVALPCETFRDMQLFHLKNWQLDGKCVMRPTSAGTYTEAHTWWVQILLSFNSKSLSFIARSQNNQKWHFEPRIRLNSIHVLIDHIPKHEKVTSNNKNNFFHIISEGGL